MSYNVAAAGLQELTKFEMKFETKLWRHRTGLASEDMQFSTGVM